ncbi:two-component system, OmpR family, response regulator QseB [Oryzomicrobium terrae]|uniref:Two-component system, OmpR family, response regulator QseB n=1 Tax=Oryzomicrobium terrae TaxID=1735038 RepID=A0A5C1E4T1_9RHOO|nr:winged helix-turn-helix domain-containing protein [Oryzomicrobium terrae]QEL63870.1 two-component system, OmpR family, response regulator QseB [Oryzomicrobium terrae]
MRLLLVEDDLLLGDGLCAGLNHYGFQVDWVRSVAAALSALATDTYAGLVLDLGLPDGDGTAVLDAARNGKAGTGGNSAVPVLLLTARDAKEDKLRAFAAGADDYVVKPVDLDELAARLRALIRRSHGRAVPRIVAGRVAFDPEARQAYLDEAPVDLSGRELAILELLLERLGRVVSRPQLEAALYRWGEGVESNAIEVHIHHLRKKLGTDFIQTRRGLGYLVEKP